MGRKSVKENKSVYQVARESLEWTREQACEEMAGMTADRLEKIENNRVAVKPEDVALMAKAYKRPELYNYYCANECFFRDMIYEAQEKDFTQATVEILVALNRLSREKERLLEIAEDGKINPSEYEDFRRIKGVLNQLSASLDNLQLWVDKQIASGMIAEDSL